MQLTTYYNPIVLQNNIIIIYTNYNNMDYTSAFHQFQETVFNIFIAVSWLLLLLTFTGIFNEYPQAFYKLAFYMKIYICVFLIWRFNPLRQFLVKKPIIFTTLDRKIAFSAGIIVLSTTAIQEYLLTLTSKERSDVKSEKNLTT